MPFIVTLIVHKFSHDGDILNTHNLLSQYHELSVMKLNTNDHIGELKEKFEKSKFKAFRVNPFEPCLLEDFPDVIITWTFDDEYIDEIDSFLSDLFTLEDFDAEKYPQIVEHLKVPKSELIKEPNQRNVYDIVRFHDTDLDIMYVQITRPYEDEPFTVLLKNYSEIGMEPLFAHIFYSKAWGLVRSDDLFLRQVWDHYNMIGVYDHDALMKKYTEKCVPHGEELPDHEPMVFRKSLKDLLTVDQYLSIK